MKPSLRSSESFFRNTTSLWGWKRILLPFYFLGSIVQTCPITRAESLEKNFLCSSENTLWSDAKNILL